MKSKFMSLIVAIAVVLAMVAVPAVPGMVAAVETDYNVTMAIEDGTGGATIYATPSNPFTMYAVIDNPDGEDVFEHMIEIDFDNTQFTVNSVNKVDFPSDMGAATIGAGTITYDPLFLTGDVPDRTTAVDITSVEIVCTAGANPGVSTVSWVYTSVAPPRKAGVIGGPYGDDMIGGNMSKMFDGTVIIGTPELTVDVSPADTGSVAGFGPFPDVSNRAWNAEVALDAQDTVAGWTFDFWSGNIDLPAATDPNQVTMDALTKSVTAHFVEMKPGLGVDPLSLSFTARHGDDTASDTVTISNTGGHVLCWALGEPPVWTAGDYWVWYNTYWEDPYGTPGFNTVQMVVTDASGDENYAASAIFDPAALRVINITTLIDPFWDHMNAQMLDASVLVDKCTLDIVQQDANLLVQMGENWIPANATVTWDFGDNCHGWPYYMYKQWSYEVATSLCVMGSPQPSEPPITAWATVTGFIPDMPLETTAETFDCWEITHSLTPDPQVGAFMQTYWSDEARNFVITADGGTYVYPPMDIRSLTENWLVQAPAASEPPEWLSFDKTHGDPPGLGIAQSETLTVTASTSGLDVGTYPGSFTISGCVCVETETVVCSLEVLEATTIDVIRNLPGVAEMADETYPGDQFDVYVNFTASVDDFNAISVVDQAPAGWQVDTDPSWCSADGAPADRAINRDTNVVEVTWFDAYPKGTEFSVMYKVTVPNTAIPGINLFPWGDCDLAWAGYHFGADPPGGEFQSCITGDKKMLVTVPGVVWGEVRDVNADLLTDVLVTLSEEPLEGGDEPEDSCSSVTPTAAYENDVDDTGLYWQRAEKWCFYTRDTNNMPSTRNPDYPLLIDLKGATPQEGADLLVAGFNLDFEGDYGLVPTACTVTYAMESVNKMNFVPKDELGGDHPEWQLSYWKAMESVNSWTHPKGCGG